ncbi:DUF985 domain protein [Corynespora cassiicola Philippines]|uniref:DUF985 domain protein n=1 Tax=Corynespora cassiicola Philippines TaxID=1448308 RepID=A0A2T2P937_CORCC|nr:DUF985 domain protein [Corynespora cassiicola Philippines]
MRFSILATLLAISACHVAGSPTGEIDIEHRSAQEIIDKLNLTANVEKGWYIETFEDPGRYGNRSYSTAIYYLLEGAVGPSIWHTVDSVEVWHHYAGAPLRLDLSYNNGTPTVSKTLGKDLFDNQAPQIVIDGGRWQRAESLGQWTLVGTTVAPGFDENGFELADPDWEPNDGSQKK